MKYNIGQVVYTVCKDFITEKVTCPICEGSGEFVHNGHTVKCPKTKTVKHIKYRLGSAFEIQSVLIQEDKVYYSDEVLDVEDRYDDYIPTYYEESNLFETKECADIFIGWKNKEDK